MVEFQAQHQLISQIVNALPVILEKKMDSLPALNAVKINGLLKTKMSVQIALMVDFQIQDQLELLIANAQLVLLEVQMDFLCVIYVKLDIIKIQ